MTRNNWLILISAGCIIIAVYEALLNRSLLISISFLAIPLSCYLVFWSDTDDDDWASGGLIESILEITPGDIRYFAEIIDSYGCDSLKDVSLRLRNQAKEFHSLKQVLDNISTREFKSCPLKVTRRTCEKTVESFVSNARMIINRLDVCQAERSVTRDDIHYMNDYLNDNDKLKSELCEYLKALGAINNDEYFTPKYHTKKLNEINNRRY